jgi:hypothetical protein
VTNFPGESEFNVVYKGKITTMMFFEDRTLLKLVDLSSIMMGGTVDIFSINHKFHYFKYGTDELEALGICIREKNNQYSS